MVMDDRGRVSGGSNSESQWPATTQCSTARVPGTATPTAWHVQAARHHPIALATAITVMVPSSLCYYRCRRCRAAQMAGSWSTQEMSLRTVEKVKSPRVHPLLCPRTPPPRLDCTHSPTPSSPAGTPHTAIRPHHST